MFIDIHCHLEMCQNIPQAIENAKKEKVGLILTQGINFDSNRKALAFSKQFKEVKAALGIYPIDALMMSDSGINKEIEFIKQNNPHAIGEVGIDLKESNNSKKQEENFIKFINLSKELDIPLIVHSRKAEELCLNILEKSMAKRVIMHCFSGKLKLIKKIIENSWYLSIPASIVYSAQAQQIAKETPLENKFCETDSPYLHPERKMNNEPANVLAVYKKIAEIKDISLSECEKAIENNYNTLFKG